MSKRTRVYYKAGELEAYKQGKLEGTRELIKKLDELNIEDDDLHLTYKQWDLVKFELAKMEKEMKP